MATSTVENYVKQIYLEHRKAEETYLPMKQLADAMAVTSGTATSMVKWLAKSGLVDYEPRNGSRLTHQGEQMALHILRRHRLVELFLVEILKLDWSEVHEEADRLEHAISDRVIEQIDSLLQKPSVDPHGDPIPTEKGKIDERRQTNLSNCLPGAHVRIARIADQDAIFLKFAERSGLIPGSAIRVLESDRVADAITLRRKEGDTITLGFTAAAKIMIESVK